jgi:selenocysteine lyase/cysteine desulfurase
MPGSAPLSVNTSIVIRDGRPGASILSARAAGIGGIRVSCHFFNTEEEIEALLGVVKNYLK